MTTDFDREVYVRALPFRDVVPSEYRLTPEELLAFAHAIERLTGCEPPPRARLKEFCRDYLLHENPYRRLRRVELHRDVDVSHALRGNQFAFVREGVVGRGQRKVDDDVEARLSQRGEIVRLRHAARGQPVINAQEIADVVQCSHNEFATIGFFMESPPRQIP